MLFVLFIVIKVRIFISNLIKLKTIIFQLKKADHPIDDVFYPKKLLKFWATKGIDISGMDAIPGLYEGIDFLNYIIHNVAYSRYETPLKYYCMHGLKNEFILINDQFRVN